MLQGRFGNASGAPYIEGHISLPRLGLRGLVSFLVDTGADGTVLMPADSRKLGVDPRILVSPTTSQGIGGPARGFNEEALLSFSDKHSIYTYLIELEIPAFATHNQHFPSLLGRDILKRWRCVIDANKNLVTFTPRTWDLRQRI
jgi:gag-polyprotein putative aspartyl protease